jgi:diketogulonate reductase-like aldo/keto reductase
MIMPTSDAFRDTRIPLRRDELFVTTKLWNTNHRPERVEAALDASLRRPQLEHIDCYLIHTPVAF